MNYEEQVNKNYKKLLKHPIHQFGTGEGGYMYYEFCCETYKTEIDYDMLIDQYALLGWEY
jgi:hypothetical protein